MRDIKASTTEAEDGHGYNAIVTYVNDDDVTIAYNSGDFEAGTFGEASDAADHADAWRGALIQAEAIKGELREDRQHRYAGEVLTLKRAARADLKQAKKLTDHAKTSKANAEAREAWVESLALSTDEPAVAVTWTDKGKPSAVEAKAVDCVWDMTFTPAEVGDPRQLSISAVDWMTTEGPDGLAKVVGYGRVEITVVAGLMTIKLGDGSDVFTGAVDKIERVETEPAPASVIEPKLGKLKPRQLIERLTTTNGEGEVKSETLLGIYSLELDAKKPRTSVIKAINGLACDREDQLLDDLGDFDTGLVNNPVIKPDLAAAALATSAGYMATTELEQLVPACLDTVVLGWILDAEMERGEDTRDEVVVVVRARIAEFGADGEGGASDDS